MPSFQQNMQRKRSVTHAQGKTRIGNRNYLWEGIDVKFNKDFKIAIIHMAWGELKVATLKEETCDDSNQHRISKEI